MNRKKLLALLLALSMVLSLLPTAAFAAEEEPVVANEAVVDDAQDDEGNEAFVDDAQDDEGNEADQDDEPADEPEEEPEEGVALLSEDDVEPLADEPTEAEKLQAAINEAANGGTVTMTADIVGMTTSEIITIPEDKEITLDMAGHSITVAEGFSGRPIANKGTLTVTGNGIIDASAAAEGYGAIRNDGTLTIMDGTYLGSVYGDGSAIRNGIGSELTVYGGYFAATGAIYNVGKATIYKGEFVTLACSGCGTPWAYALNNRDESGISGTMLIAPEKDEDVKVHGTQGALSAVATTGGVTVEGGTFWTEPCEAKNHKGSTFYAVYVSGKAGMPASCVINGGKFSTTGGNACIYVNNTNPSDNGGEPGQGILEINGGSFDQGPDAKLVTFTGKNGSKLAISGGSFSSDVSDYCADGFQMTYDEATGKYGVAEKDYVAQIGETKYETLQAAIAAAQAGDTVTLLADEEVETWTQVGLYIEPLAKNVTIDGGNHKLTIKSIYSKGNGNRITYGAEGLTVKDLTVDQTGLAGGFGITNGSKLENVKIIGGTYGVLTGSNVSIENCTFENVKHAIYTNESGTGTGVKVTGCTFDGGRAMILRNNEEFTNNTIKASCTDGITVSKPSTATISGNTFEAGSRIKLYQSSSEVSKNTILGNVALDGAVTSVDLSGNYWGDNGPTEMDKVVVTNYYTDPEMTTLAVGPGVVAQVGEQYFTSIPAAIAAANSGDTVTIIKEGEYAPITVPAGVTVEAAANVAVTFKNTGSARMLMGAGATLKNVTVDNTGNDASAWTKATAVGYTNGNGFTLDGCTIVGSGEGIAILHCNDKELTITNCTIKDFTRGYYACGDNNALGVVNITNNTFENVKVPVDCYWGEPATEDTLITITGNTFDDGSYIQLWDYTQYLAWESGKTADATAVNAEIKANTGDVTVLATHCNWFVESKIDSDVKPVYTRLVAVEAEGLADNTELKANGTLIGFEDHTTAKVKNGKASFYYLPEGEYTIEINGTDYSCVVSAPKAGEAYGETLTLTVEENHTHSWDEGIVTVEPTCAEEGEKLFTCACGSTKTETIEKTESHTFGAWVTDTAAQVGVAGSRHRDCTVCGHRETGTIPALPAPAPVEPTTPDPDPEDEEEEDLNEQETPLEARPWLFTDVTEGVNWFYASVKAMYDRNLISGLNETVFGPKDSITRGQLVAILYRMEKEPEVTGESLFADVADDMYYAKAIRWAHENGVVKGQSDNIFGADDAIRRQDVAVILYRYAQYKGYARQETGDLSVFTDVDQLQRYAVEAMTWAVGAGLISGVGNNKLNPRGGATRAEACALLDRFLNWADAHEQGNEPEGQQ